MAQNRNFKNFTGGCGRLPNPNEFLPHRFFLQKTFPLFSVIYLKENQEFIFNLSINFGSKSLGQQ